MTNARHGFAQVLRALRRCPGCGYAPSHPAALGQLRADLALTWVVLDRRAGVECRHHCVRCAPKAIAGFIADLECSWCGDGPLVFWNSARERAVAVRFPAAVHDWLVNQGWLLGELSCCPQCASAPVALPRQRQPQ